MCDVTWALKSDYSKSISPNFWYVSRVLTIKCMLIRYYEDTKTFCVTELTRCRFVKITNTLV